MNGEVSLCHSLNLSLVWHRANDSIWALGQSVVKNLLLGSAALLLCVGSATAADMPTKMPVKAAPVVGYDWNGFYP